MSGMATSATSTETSGQPVSGCYEDAWQAVRATHQILSDRIGQELSEAGLPELAWHDVLARLEESPEPLRPKDMLCRVGVTKSGLTRLLDRIEAAGLIERRSCPSDRRGTWLAITDEGSRTLAEMKPIRNRVFSDHLAGRLSPEEAEVVSEMLGRVSASVRDELEGEGRCEL
jgi:DNA-binding MarR family transcriptional regulator